jgi:hypothetical protein
MNQTTLNTTQPGSWKKARTAIRGSVSKFILISFSVATVELKASVTVEVPRPHTPTHTHTHTHTQSKDRKVYSLIFSQICDPTNQTDANLQLNSFSYRDRTSRIVFCEFC